MGLIIAPMISEGRAREMLAIGANVSVVGELRPSRYIAYDELLKEIERGKLPVSPVPKNDFSVSPL
jgi:hypothetical protein